MDDEPAPAEPLYRDQSGSVRRTKTLNTEEIDTSELLPVQPEATSYDITVSNEQYSTDDISKQGVLRTLMAIGISFMIIFSAFDAFCNLQSTLNMSGGLGTIGLSFIYAFMIITSMLISTFTLSRYHGKWIIVFSMLTYIVYMATGFYPSWYTIVPASAVIGVGAAHLWLAVVIYVTDIAMKYAVLTKTKEQDRVNLFLGIFYGFMYTSQIWGNLISSLVFQRESNNATVVNNDDCGSIYCASSGGNGTVVVLPSSEKVHTFTGICLGLGAVSIGVLAVFAVTVKTNTQNQSSALETVRQVTKHLMTSKDQQLLILPSVFAGLWNGFAVGDFTMAYISCPYGIENVGFVMITYGIGQSLCSVVFGKLSQYTGHLLIYVVGCFAMLGALLTILFWTPGQGQFYVVFILAFLFGLGVAVNNPIVIAHYNLYMKNNLQTAQSSYRLLNSLGWAVAFGYSSALCTHYKIYVLLCSLVLSLICVTILNCQHKLTS